MGFAIRHHGGSRTEIGNGSAHHGDRHGPDSDDNGRADRCIHRSRSTRAWATRRFRAWRSGRGAFSLAEARRQTYNRLRRCIDVRAHSPGLRRTVDPRASIDAHGEALLALDQAGPVAASLNFSEFHVGFADRLVPRIGLFRIHIDDQFFDRPSNGPRARHASASRPRPRWTWFESTTQSELGVTLDLATSPATCRAFC